ncbi:SDR family NAD(P)-dependent oxidoreductase [Candidatus Poriferisocius sp.]|uniref:SDR family NAD(P)-dependent oxidoreductase n=1 Tax=Candidatus Poriferisocius sp. TaxID=3101276 RepID=UPI003B022430
MSDWEWTLGGLESPVVPIWNDSNILDPSSVLLTDKVAIVTGGARGIGAATAVALARFGADLAICDREADDMARTAAAVEALGRRCVTGLFDVRHPEPRDAWLAEVGETYGRVDVLVNNAGGTFNSPFAGISPKGEAALIAENFTQVTGFIRGCLPLMGEGGSIINVTSIEAHRAGPGFSIYSAMKAAQANLTMSLSLELSSSRIRVNCIAPDVIPTEGESLLGGESTDDESGLAPQPWLEGGTVHDCAAAAVYLAGDMSRFVTGTTIHVDGGNIAAAGWKRRTSGRFTT